MQAFLRHLLGIRHHVRCVSSIISFNLSIILYCRDLLFVFLGFLFCFLCSKTYLLIQKYLKLKEDKPPIFTLPNSTPQLKLSLTVPYVPVLFP